MSIECTTVQSTTDCVKLYDWSYLLRLEGRAGLVGKDFDTWDGFDDGMETKDQDSLR